MNQKLVRIIFIAVIVGILLGRWTMKLSSDITRQTKTDDVPLYWIDPMVPSVHYPGPGTSPMGMELVPITPNKLKKGSDDDVVLISPSVINNLGVRTAIVKKTVLAKQIETVGYVEPDENKITHIHTYAEGWIKNLVVKSLGDTVKANQLLLQYYSPMLVSAQDEYLIAMKGNSQSLINAAYKKLQALHISEQQIEQIKTSHHSNELVAIYAPQDGIITELNIREGMRVTPDIDMMSLVDLSNIWMIAQIFEEQANWVQVGDPAVAQIPAFPQKQWRGNVEYIYPLLDPITRTVKVRFRFENADKLLKPNMYATIFIKVKPKSNVLSIPIEALIRSSHDDRVIVYLGEGRFQVRKVTAGIESGDEIEISSGLNEGEKIVISGQFLLDSESNLKAGLERIDTPKDEMIKKSSMPQSKKAIKEGKDL